MKPLLLSIFLCTSTFGLYAADSAKASISQMENGSLSGMEREWVSLAEAMPADKYNFAPTNGAFEGVRTFQQQVGHVATVLYVVSSGVLEQKPPVELGTGENGPATLKTKDDYVKFLKDAFAYAHKAMQSLTNDNFTDMVPSPFGGGKKMPRGSLAEMTVSHSFDHFGQAVVYARMNNIVPPSSRK
jgi:hypothetical protein